MAPPAKNEQKDAPHVKYAFIYFLLNSWSEKLFQTLLRVLLLWKSLICFKL